MSIAKQSRASQPDQSIDGAAFSMEVVDDICALEARYAGYFAPGYFEQYGAAGGYIDGLEVEPLFDHAVAAGTFDMRSPRSQKRDEVASIPATSVTWLPSETTTRSSAACGGHWTSKPKTWTTPSISPTPTPRCRGTADDDAGGARRGVPRRAPFTVEDARPAYEPVVAERVRLINHTCIDL
jgi:hypothetical protein